MRPKLFQVLPIDDFKVYLYYDNGAIRLYDCSWFKQEEGIFEQLHDVQRFKELCTIMNGTSAFSWSSYPENTHKKTCDFLRPCSEKSLTNYSRFYYNLTCSKCDNLL